MIQNNPFFMLTLEKVNAQLAALAKDAEFFKRSKERKDKTALKRIEKQILHLRDIALFLQTFPSREMVERERLKAQEILQRVNTPDHYKRWHCNNRSDADGVSNPKALHDRIFEVKKHKRHYDNAGYILQVNAE